MGPPSGMIWTSMRPLHVGPASLSAGDASVRAAGGSETRPGRDPGSPTPAGPATRDRAAHGPGVGWDPERAVGAGGHGGHGGGATVGPPNEARTAAAARTGP